jgi:hypothetical protein
VDKRVRRAISLKLVSHYDDVLWSFVMLPDAKPVSVFFLFPLGPCIACLLVLTTFARRW